MCEPEAPLDSFLAAQTSWQQRAMKAEDHVKKLLKKLEYLKRDAILHRR
jgi:hypothetical protein